jgi:glycosyltransferase involved in cell wall biosynthesis
MISLVVATFHRTSELERLLARLELQSFKDFEVVVVDQNADERLADILGRHHALKIRHLRCELGASRARNAGLRAAEGSVIGFPDDDCWYANDLLQRVNSWFESHPESDGLLGILRDENNQPTGPKWPQGKGAATKETLWNSGITPVVFLTRHTVQTAGFFDEEIGPGTASGYASGEDLDYFLRCVERGLHLRHDYDLAIRHPSFHRAERIRDTSYSYALGGGYILRKHRYSIRKFLDALVRSLAGMVVYSVKGDFFKARSYALRAAGLARGYFFGPREISKVASLTRTPERNQSQNPTRPV